MAGLSPEPIDAPAAEDAVVAPAGTDDVVAATAVDTVVPPLATMMSRLAVPLRMSAFCVPTIVAL